MNIANIKKIRIAKGLTQGELAIILGVSQSYVSQVENGEKNFSIDVARRFADALGVRLSMLFE